MKNRDKKDFKFVCLLSVWIIVSFAIAILYGSEDGIIIGHLFCAVVAFPIIKNKKFRDWLNKE